MEPSKTKNEGTGDRRSGDYYSPSPVEPPPTYSEAMRTAPDQDANFYLPQLSAPPSTLGADNATLAYPVPAGAVAPGPYSQPAYSNAPSDPRNQKWDDNATRILITNRLQMNEQFSNAKSALERELLWHVILNDLLCSGYHYTIFDLMNFWELQFQLYKSIIDSLSSGGSQSADWPYFEPMHNVFQGSVSRSSDLLDVAAVTSPSTVLSIPITTPHAVVPPPSVTTEGQPSSDASTAVVQTQGPTSTSASAPTPSEHAPLLTHGDAPQSDVLHTAGSVNGLGTSALVDKDAVQMASPNEFGGGSGDALRDTFLTSNPPDLNFSKTVTTQPEGLSMPKFLDNDVVTVQPTTTMTAIPVTTSDNHAAARHQPNDCFCFFCCVPSSDGHGFGHHYHGDDGDGCYSDSCCCDDGGCCDGGDGGCCDGGDGGCCDGGCDGGDCGDCGSC